jgi:hypothetical protein
MEPSWNAEKYQTTVIVGAFEKLLAKIHRKPIQGTFRVEFLQEVLIDVPSLSGSEENLLYDVKSSKNPDEQVAKIAKLCERLVKDKRLARSHEGTVKGMACILQKLSATNTLSKDAQKIASDAARLASELFMSPFERAVDIAYHFFRRIFFSPFS